MIVHRYFFAVFVSFTVAGLSAALGLAGCASFDVRLKISGDTKNLARIEITAYAATTTCDEVAFGVVPQSALSPAFLSSVEKVTDSSAILAGLPRLGDKLLVAQGLDSAGRVRSSGCVAIGELVDDMEVEINLVARAVVTVDPIQETQAGAQLTVRLSDLDGMPLENRRVAWRWYGAGGGPGGTQDLCGIEGLDGCETTLQGAAQISLPTSAAAGPIAIEPIVEWGDVAPGLERYFVGGTSSVFCERRVIDCVPIAALGSVAAPGQDDLLCVSNAPSSTNGEVEIYQFDGAQGRFSYTLRAEGPNLSDPVAVYQIGEREVLVLDRPLLPRRLRATRIQVSAGAVTSSVAWELSLGLLNTYQGGTYVPDCGSGVAGLALVTFDPLLLQTTTTYRTLSGATPAWAAQVPANVVRVAEGGCLTDAETDAQYPGVVFVDEDNQFVPMRITPDDNAVPQLAPVPLSQASVVDVRIRGGYLLEVAIHESGLNVVASRYAQSTGQTIPGRHVLSAAPPASPAVFDMDADGMPDMAWPVRLAEDRTVLQVTRGAQPDGLTIAGFSPLLTPDAPELLTDAALVSGDFDGDGRDDLALFNSRAVLLQRAIAGTLSQTGDCF